MFSGGRERVYWEKDLFSDVLSSSSGNMVLRDSIFFALKIKNKSVFLPKLNLFLFLIFDWFQISVSFFLQNLFL